MWCDIAFDPLPRDLLNSAVLYGLCVLSYNDSMAMSLLKSVP